MDCTMAPEKVIARCMELGINCIAVADHGTVEGGLRTQELAPFPVVVAEEVLTPHGEIMGVFLKESIPTCSSAREAIDRIRAQGGLVCLPHPFDTFRGLRLNVKEIEELVADIDIIEAFNARSPFTRPTTRATAFADKHGIPKCAGSDAHALVEIGNAYVEMPEFSDKEGYLEALARGRIRGFRSNPLVHFHSLWAKLRSAF